MKDKIPMNELDRAVAAMAKSKSAVPDFYRALAAGTDGELFFLIRNHPELQGDEVFKIENGMPLPFVLSKERGRDVVMLFSSAERADEAMKKAKKSPLYFVPASMPARQMLELLGKMELFAVVNQGCSTGGMMIPPELMRDLATGEALKPLPTRGQGETQEMSLRIIEPADYPTDIVQPLFEVMKKHAPFKAAWIFTRPGNDEAPKDEKPTYYVMVWMNPRDAAAFHELNMVAASVRAGKDFDISFQIADQNDTEAVKVLFETGTPFFRSPDCPQP